MSIMYVCNRLSGEVPPPFSMRLQVYTYTLCSREQVTCSKRRKNCFSYIANSDIAKSFERANKVQVVDLVFHTSCLTYAAVFQIKTTVQKGTISEVLAIDFVCSIQDRDDESNPLVKAELDLLERLLMDINKPQTAGESVSIQWNHSVVDTLGTYVYSSVSCTERCPHFRGKFLLRKHIGTKQSVLNTGCGLLHTCMYVRVHILVP